MATTRTKRTKKTETNIIDSVSNLTTDDIVKQIGGLQVNLQGTLSGLSAAITSKLEQMHDLSDAIGIKKDELTDLCEIENEAVNHAELRDQFGAEHLNWVHERNKRQEQWLEEAAVKNKQRQRDDEEWSYNFNQKRAKAETEFNAEVDDRKRQESIRESMLKRGWDVRESELVEKEDEFESMKIKVTGFDVKLIKAVEDAKAETEDKIRLEYNHQIQLKDKDFSSQKEVLANNNNNLTLTITGLKNQLGELQTQLEAARTDAKDVTSQALQSASGRQVASALQKVVDSSQPSGKK